MSTVYVRKGGRTIPTQESSVGFREANGWRRVADPKTKAEKRAALGAARAAATSGENPDAAAVKAVEASRTERSPAKKGSN
jgi:hypothetical protein